MKKDDNNGSEELARFLKSKRLATGLSQGAIAKKLGYTSPQFISNWERALCMPPIHILEKLAQIFSCDPLEFKEEVLQIELKQLEAELRAKFFPLPSTIPHIPTKGKNIGSSLSNTPLEKRFEYLKFQINERGWEIVSDISEFKNFRSKLKFKCPDGHIFPYLAHHAANKKRGCPVCSGFHMSIQRVKEIADKNGWVCESEKYTTPNANYKFRCKSCNFLRETRYHHIQKFPRCRGCEEVDSSISSHNRIVA